jgi:hypothetical protein
MSKVLGLTRKNDEYADVPDDLKWAVSLHEHLSSAEAVRDAQMRMAQAKQRVDAELAATCRQKEQKKRR